jgi:threonine dehydrogenase-like Zn-dependent dehydrogenase
MAKVRAWVVSAPGKMELQEFDKPDVAEDAALLKVEACGICGTDKHMYSGQFVGTAGPFPGILGHEIIGTVVEMGRQAAKSMIVSPGQLSIGDRVALNPNLVPCGRCWYCLHMPHRPGFCLQPRGAYGFIPTSRKPGLFGGYAEYIYILPNSYLFKLPKEMPMKRAVLVEPMATGLRAVERAYGPGESSMGQGYGLTSNVMVLGAGPIGLATIVALRFSGAGFIIVQDMFANRLGMARNLGADLLIDGTSPLADRLKRVREATEGVGPDVVIEAAGAPGAFREAIDFVRRGGKVIEAGNFTNNGPTEIIPFIACMKDVDIHGSFGYPAVSFAHAISILEKTPLPVEDIVTHVFPLDEFPKAMQLTGSANVGKAVIAPWLAK